MIICVGSAIPRQHSEFLTVVGGHEQHYNVCPLELVEVLSLWYLAWK
jgi:hypothetical protein